MLKLSMYATSALAIFLAGSLVEATLQQATRKKITRRTAFVQVSRNTKKVITNCWK